MSTRSDTATVPDVKVNDGRAIPQLGFGVFQVPPEDTADAVATALEVGYRSIDTAAAYRNERGVAGGIERAGLGRGDVYITTKLANGDHGRDTAHRALERSLERLRTDHVDLYLIHWPLPSQDKYVETWQALCEAREEGRARSIGVSNFLPEHLDRIIDATGEVPAVNQIELHPHFQQAELRRFHAERGIVTEAWSPLGRGGGIRDPAIEEIAEHLHRTPAQVVLRWHVQLGNVVIPKSATPARIEENFWIFDFELDDRQMGAIGKLDTGERIGPDPATFGQ